jgi:hypothetical protein
MLKREAIAQELPPGALIQQEVRDEVSNVRAVMVHSDVIEDRFWLVIEHSF